jgi:hypothetical protein
MGHKHHLRFNRRDATLKDSSKSGKSLQRIFSAVVSRNTQLLLTKDLIVNPAITLNSLLVSPEVVSWFPR